LNFDLKRALRRIDPQRAIGPSSPTEELSLVVEPVAAGPQLLLDTCVYIDILQGKTTHAVDMLLELRLINHSVVCLSKLTHLFGRLDPADPRTKNALKEISGVIADIPKHRLGAPSAQACGEAGMLVGLIERSRRPQDQTQRSDSLNDAMIFLQALEEGQIVLTRNMRDFETFLRLVPTGRVLFYKA
jgi:predicted nucleic acid-binding protein